MVDGGKCTLTTPKLMEKMFGLQIGTVKSIRFIFIGHEAEQLGLYGHRVAKNNELNAGIYQMNKQKNFEITFVECLYRLWA